MEKELESIYKVAATDNDFNSLLKMSNSQIPASVLINLNQQILDNRKLEKGRNRGIFGCARGFTDRERRGAIRVNQALFDWVNREVEAKNEPDATAMKKKSSDLRIPIESTLPTIAELKTVPIVSKQDLAKEPIPIGVITEPKTKAEYEALPTGTEYIHPDGTKRTKK